ncbi:MAG: hypothetical protein V4543_12070 [Bacteroidota bacterium]
MYDFRPNLVIGFHGCDESVKSELINSSGKIRKSINPYDWLGHGMYFWENNFERALQFAGEKESRGEIHKPAVVGAVLQLGYCCDFLDTKFIELLRKYYLSMAKDFEATGLPLPVNRNLRHDLHNNHLLRYLDCAIIEFMHKSIFSTYIQETAAKGFSNIKIFESVRGVFTEGGPVFDGAGIFEKSHIQICIRNPDCIKGFFNPRESSNLEDWADRGI